MSVHKIRLFYSHSGADDFHSWLTQWHESIKTDTADKITNKTPSVSVSRLDGNEYYTATLTYPSDENLTVVLEEPYKKLTEYCDWSKVGYHKCDDVSDNPNKSDCHYLENKIHRDGDIPEHIPSLK
jgi:hypothetical protein